MNKAEKEKSVGGGRRGKRDGRKGQDSWDTRMPLQINGMEKS
jgi:hypothetical protein